MSHLSCHKLRNCDKCKQTESNAGNSTKAFENYVDHLSVHSCDREKHIFKCTKCYLAFTVHEEKAHTELNLLTCKLCFENVRELGNLKEYFSCASQRNCESCTVVENCTERRVTSLDYFVTSGPASSLTVHVLKCTKCDMRFTINKENNE